MQLELGQQLSLYYKQQGRGTKILLAFHGYANDCTLFDALVPYLQEEYTILSFDLPFHGKSAWPPGLAFTETHLCTLVNQVLELYKVEKISLLGYSLGGRVAINIAQLKPEHISTICLIASDGLIKNRLYNFVNNTFIGQSLFRHFVYRPGLYLLGMQLVYRLKLIPDALYKFIISNIKEEQDRIFLWHVWQSTRGLLVNDFDFVAVVKKYALPVKIIMGRYDRIIPLKNADAFIDVAGIDIVVLDKSHNIIKPDSAADISAIVKS